MNGPNHSNSESSSFDSEDLNLVAFLKANRPPIPEPHPRAEERLMQCIAESQTQSQQQTQKMGRSMGRKRGWIIGAITLTSALIGSLLWQFRPQDSGVFAQRELELEAFLVETWQGVSSPEDNMVELDWLSTVDSISHTDLAPKSFAYQSHIEESNP